VGEYGPDFNIAYVREEDGQLHALVHWFFDYPLTEAGSDTFAFPNRGLYRGEEIAFSRGADGRATSVTVSGVQLPRRSIAPEDGSTFKIKLLRPAEELLKDALAATPPKESGDFLTPELVEVAKLDRSIKLEIRYATTNNFVSTAFYQQPRAFLQRPAAEALVRANRRLKTLGYGLLIYDSYRPWYVTRMFWDATPDDKKVFVANPAQGSRHNRGCAVDLTLYDLRTGRPVDMVSGYDEFSDRAYPDYPGGTSLQRWHRKLLRRAMEAEGFTVYNAEWWHFDYKDWKKYPVLNVRFEDFGR
jgi:D-alanyl-D-alanine dipeptidase